MSNPNVSGPRHSLPLTPVSPAQPAQPLAATAQPEQAPQLVRSPSSFDTGSSKAIAQPEELSGILDKVEQADPSQLLKRSLTAPNPLPLTNKLANQISTPPPLAKKVIAPASKPQLLDDASMKLLMTKNFGTILHKMDTTWRRLSSKKDIQNQALERAKAVVKNAPPGSDLTWTIVQKSDRELRELLAQGIGELKSKHLNKNFSQLSPNKQAFIDATIEGFKQGLSTEQRQQARALADNEGVQAESILQKQKLTSQLKGLDQANKLIKPSPKSLARTDLAAGKSIQIAKAKIRSDLQAINAPQKYSSNSKGFVQTEISLQAIYDMTNGIIPQQADRNQLPQMKQDLSQALQNHALSDKIISTIAMLPFQDLELVFATRLKNPSDEPLSPQQEVTVKELASFLQTESLKIFDKQLSTQGNTKLNRRDKEGDPQSVTINGKEYIKQRILGQGSFGKAIEFVSRDNPADKVVLKRFMKREKESDRHWFENMQVEIRQHRNAMGESVQQAQADLTGLSPAKQDSIMRERAFLTGREKVLELKGVVFERNATSGLGEFFTITEPAEKGEVRDLVNTFKDMTKSGDLSASSRDLFSRLILKDALDGMAYLQRERNFIHLDLKPENIFVTRDGVAKIADFGLATSTQKIGNKQVGAGGTQPYMSPEVSEKFIKDPKIAIHRNVDYNSDTWSLGIITRELMQGKLSLPGTEKMDYINANYEFGQNKDKRVFEAPTASKNKAGQLVQNYNQSAYEQVVNSMLHPDPEKRPTLETLADHEFFADPILANPRLRGLMVELSEMQPQEDDFMDSLGLSQFSKRDQQRIQAIDKEIQQMLKQS